MTSAYVTRKSRLGGLSGGQAEGLVVACHEHGAYDEVIEVSRHGRFGNNRMVIV